MTLTQQLVQLIRNKPITEEDLHQASLFTLDAVASAIGGRVTEPGKILRQWHQSQGRDAGRNAFLLGGLTHILEIDDLHRASVTHPGCVVVPAVLAVALREIENGKTVTGRDFLTAVLRGFEAMCRVGMAVGKEHYRIWHNTATCGPFGSAMATASLIGLTDEQCVHALGNAGTQSSGLWQFLETGAMSKHLHAGRAAESGIVAADLAALGFTGPAAILEGEKGLFAGNCPDAKPEAVNANPEQSWQLLLTSIKPWPSCRHTHPAIDAALELHTQLIGRGVVSIQADVYQAAMDVCDRPTPSNEYEAKFSLYHCVAAALNDGMVDFNSFNEHARERLAELRNRVQCQVSEPYRSAYPNEYWGAKITVTTADGETLIADRRVCKGDPNAVLSDDDMLTKAMMLMTHGDMDADQAQRILEAVMNLSKDQLDIEALYGIFPAD